MLSGIRKESLAPGQLSTFPGWKNSPLKAEKQSRENKFPLNAKCPMGGYP
jgi:hypothetical protein